MSGTVLWADGHLLFWLSLIPFAREWMGETGFARMPVALYGVVLPRSAVAFTILTRGLVAMPGANEAMGSDTESRVSLWRAADRTLVVGGAFVTAATSATQPAPPTGLPTATPTRKTEIGTPGASI